MGSIENPKANIIIFLLKVYRPFVGTFAISLRIAPYPALPIIPALPESEQSTMVLRGSKSPYDIHIERVVKVSYGFPATVL